MVSRLLSAGIRRLPLLTVLLAVTSIAVASIPEAQQAAALSPAVNQCQIENGYNVKPFRPENCNGTYQGGLCKGGYFQDIFFAKPFNGIPKVLVTARHISDQGGCVGGATDTWKAHPTDITPVGFRLWVSGSPVGSSCGAWSGWHSIASADWTAFEDSVACKTEGENGITPATCPGTNHGGICSKPWVTPITFTEKFDKIPHVLVTAERVSDQGGCVGSATDSVICNPQDVSTEGFDLVCAGSP